MFAGPYTKYLTSTILSFKNTLDWMTGDEDLVDTALLGGHRGREPRGRAVAAKSKASAPLLADSHATANDPRPPPNGIFRPGEADRAATKGSPAALTLGSDGAEPRVLLDSAAKPGIKGSGSVDLATQNDPRVGAVPIRFALSLEAQQPKKPTDAGGTATLVSLKITRAKISAPGVPADLSSALAKLNGSHIEYQVGTDGSVSSIHSRSPMASFRSLAMPFEHSLTSCSTWHCPFPADRRDRRLLDGGFARRADGARRRNPSTGQGGQGRGLPGHLEPKRARATQKKQRRCISAGLRPARSKFQ